MTCLHICYVNAGSISYEYDNLNRLTDIIYRDGTVIKYQYDDLGNRTSVKTFYDKIHDSINYGAIVLNLTWPTFNGIGTMKVTVETGTSTLYFNLQPSNSAELKAIPIGENQIITVTGTNNTNDIIFLGKAAGISVSGGIKTAVDIFMTLQNEQNEQNDTKWNQFLWNQFKWK